MEEKIRKEHPHLLVKGKVKGCPWHYGLEQEEDSPCGRMKCGACWKRTYYRALESGKGGVQDENTDTKAAL